MKSYLVVDINVTDSEKLMQYVGQITGLIKKHEGRYLVRGVEPVVISGETAAPEHLVVIEFPDPANTRAFLEERADLGLADLFKSATSHRIIMLDGVDAA